MTIQYRTVPTYLEPLVKLGNTVQSWYRWFQAMQSGVPAGAESAIVVTASPFTYTAKIAGTVIVDAGTVSAVAFMRVGTYTTGATAGIFSLSSGDSLIVTYSGKPTMTFVPA